MSKVSIPSITSGLPTAAIFEREPHAEMIYQKRKTLIVKPVTTKQIGRELLLVDEEFGYGTIVLRKKFVIDSIEKFNKLISRHRITDVERVKWWGKDFEPLFAYTFDFTPMEEPLPVKIPNVRKEFIKEVSFMSNDAKDYLGELRNYEPKKVTTKKLMQDWELILSLYSDFMNKKKTVEFSFEKNDLEDMALKVLKELTFRDIPITPNGYNRWHKELYSNTTKKFRAMHYDLANAENLAKVEPHKTDISKKGDRMYLKDILNHFSSFYTHKPLVYIVGGIVNNGFSDNDIDILIKDSVQPNLPLEMRIFRQFPEKYWGRFQFIYDCDNQGPFTNHIPLYDNMIELRKNANIVEMSDYSFNCQCLECGYVEENDKHCNELTCPKCGGEMRREDRPGVGFDEGLLEDDELDDFLNLDIDEIALEKEFEGMEREEIEEFVQKVKGIKARLGFAPRSIWFDFDTRNLEIKKFLNMPQFHKNRDGGMVGKDQILQGHKSKTRGDTYSSPLFAIHERVYKIWTRKGSKVLDPTCGYDQRGHIAKMMGLDYVGIDISPKAIEWNKKTIPKVPGSGSCHYVNGDMTQGNSEIVDRGPYDLVFFSPPYPMIERYQPVDGQITNITGSVEKYNTKILRLIDTASDNMKKGGYMAVVISDARIHHVEGLNPYHADIIKMGQQAGLVLWDIIPFFLRSFSARLYGAYVARGHTAKMHEYVVVFKKVR